MEITQWNLPQGDAVLERINITELGNVMARFKLEDAEGHVTYVNYPIAKIDELLHPHNITRSTNG